MPASGRPASLAVRGRSLLGRRARALADRRPPPLCERGAAHGARGGTGPVRGRVTRRALRVARRRRSLFDAPVAASAVERASCATHRRRSARRRRTPRRATATATATAAARAREAACPDHQGGCDDERAFWEGSTRGVSRFHLESAVPSWSQRFGVGVSVESAPSGWSQVFWVGVSVESARSHWSQLLQLESAWSQVFWVGVSVESALSHWSQPLQLESAWSQQLRSLHAGASWSGRETAGSSMPEKVFLKLRKTRISRTKQLRREIRLWFACDF